MKAQRLKNAILQLAVQGKLVPQNEQDEPAHILLEKIRAEKAQLIKDKKVKAEKPLPPITDQEKPFDIPDTWEWVRLGDLCYKLTDGTHSTPKYTKQGVPFLSVKDMSSGIIDFSNTKFISVEEHQELYKRCNPETGDLLLTKVGTTGIPIIVDTDKQFSLFVSVALLKMNWQLINAKFLCNTIKSPLVYQQVQENTRGVGNKNWVMRDIANTILPFPPLSEQRRIVEKIEQFMPFVEQYDQYEQELSTLEIKFPQDLKKSILQYAVKGKLVPQNETDEPASVLLEKIRTEKAQLIKDKKIKAEKPLAPITDEEKPYDIPDTWEWARLAEVGIIVGGGTPKTDNLKNWENGNIPWITPADMKNVQGKYVCRGNRNITQYGLASSSAQLMPANSLLFSSRAPIGYVGIAKNELCTNQGFKSIVPINGGVIPFIYYVLIALTPNIQRRASGTTFKEISGTEFGLTVIPVPPLAEQRRIVEKVESLLALCDTLTDESKLRQYQLPKQMENVIAFPAFEPEEHLVAARADEISVETRTKEAERLALLKRSRK